MLDAPVKSTSLISVPPIAQPPPALQGPTKKNLTAEQRLEINKKVNALTGWGVSSVEKLKGAVNALLRSITSCTSLTTVEPLHKKMHHLYEAKKNYSMRFFFANWTRRLGR